MSFMTAEPHTGWLPPRGRPLTKADLGAMPDDGRRYELMDGVLIVSPAPSWRHQRVVLLIASHLHQLCPPELMAFVAPLDVTYADDTVLQPDVLVVRRSDLGERELEGGPLLAIEVLSPSTKHIDLASKRTRYEAEGCPSYWVIDPLAPSIVCWELTDGAYVEVARAGGEEPVSLTRPFPVSFAPADLVD